jgi:hypothetical protein
MIKLAKVIHWYNEISSFIIQYSHSYNATPSAMKSGLIRGVTSLEQGETIQLYFIITVNNFRIVSPCSREVTPLIRPLFIAEGVAL